MKKKTKLTQRDIEMLIDDRNFSRYLEWVKYSQQFTREALAEAGVLKGTPNYGKNLKAYFKKYKGGSLATSELHKAIIRPFKGCCNMSLENMAEDAIEFIHGMGYYVYEDPTMETRIIVSDRMLTYGDLKAGARRFGINLKWWDKETDFNDHLNDTLDEYIS